MRYYNRAIELHPPNADAFVARGAAQANNGRLNEAASDFRHAIHLDPGSRNAANYLETVEKNLTRLQQTQQHQTGGGSSSLDVKGSGYVSGHQEQMGDEKRCGVSNLVEELHQCHRDGGSDSKPPADTTRQTQGNITRAPI